MFYSKIQFVPLFTDKRGVRWLAVDGRRPSAAEAQVWSKPPFSSIRFSTLCVRQIRKEKRFLTNVSLTRPDHHQPHSPPAQLLQLSPAPSNSITSNISTRPPSSFDYNSFRNQPQMSPQYPPPAVRGKRGLAGPREQQQMQPPSQVYYHTERPAPLKEIFLIAYEFESVFALSDFLNQFWGWFWKVMAYLLGTTVRPLQRRG